MTTQFFIFWTAILIFDGALIAFLAWAAESERFGRYRIRTPKNYQIPTARRRENISLNNLLSLLIFIAFLYYFGESQLYAGWPGGALLLGESLGVLMLYDLMYYFYHRGMHHPFVLKHVHRIHHLVRYPTAPESIFLHPLELLGALALLFLAIWIVGPISGASFLVVFMVYSTANILVHSNLVIPHPAFRLPNFWAEKHDIHHARLQYNYASIFPFWDQAFGTYK